ncbi:MAG: flagellar hook-basal body complex protein [Pseudomonadota bacterium]
MQMSSLFNGYSGIKAHTSALASVADNLANQSTTGFKGTRPEFRDIMASQIYNGTSAVQQVGNGALVSPYNVMTQGSFMGTDQPLDLAISGNGFFTVKPETGTEYYYTRDGAFRVDSEGFLINDLGYRVQGAMGGGSASLGDLQFDFNSAVASPTSEVQWALNLNAGDTEVHDQGLDVDPTNPDTFNWQYGIEVYDAEGNSHNLVTYFQHLDSYSGDAPADSAHVWKASVFENVGGVYTANPLQPTNNYYLHFDTDGRLVGTSQAYGATGDSFRSEAGVNSASAPVSNRLGETLGFSGASDVAYSTRADLTFAGGTAGTETVTVGGVTFTLGPHGSAQQAANDLAEQINNSAGVAAYAVANNGSVTIYADPGAEAMDVAASGSGLTLDGSTGLNELVNDLTNGLAASGAIDLTALAAGDSVSVAGATFTEGVDFTDAATLAAAINGAGLGVTAVDNGGNGVYLGADAVGAAGNAITLTATGGVLVSGASLAGGVEDSAASLVDATVYTQGGNNYLRLARSDTGVAATMTTATDSTLGAGLGLDFNTYAELTVASVGTTSAETEGLAAMDFNLGATTQNIAFNFAPEASDGTTQSAGSNEVVYMQQDGTNLGALESVSVDELGNVIGLYANGEQEVVASLTLTGFANAAGLQRKGDNLWAATEAAGEAVLGLAGGTEGLGTIESGFLEQANVDLSKEFVAMINYQRAYQANTKSVSASDEMLKEAINLKR